MVNYTDISNVVLDNKYISESDVRQNELFNEKSYAWIIRCKLDVLKKWIPIVIGIPDDWELNLFDFYLMGDLPFIPHVDKKGKLCLFDLEGAIIYPKFEGLFNQCIIKAKELIEDGISGKNKEDFIKEFDSYFALLNDISIAHVSLPTEKKATNIKFCEIASKSKRRKNESFAAYIKRKNNVKYFASTNQKDFDTWGKKGTQKNGIYLYINPLEYIYPPNIFDYKLDEFLNRLLSFIDFECFNKLEGKCSNKLILVFEIKQDDNTVNTCGFMIENPKFLAKDKVQLVSFTRITPLSIHRLDVDYLSSRTSFLPNEVVNKSILLIGCGSIGGYVFHDLIKSGCKNITLVDNDILKPENVFRHFLGTESTYGYKAVSLVNYAKKTLPEINAKAISEKIEDAIIDCDLNFDDFDYIVSATGNHTLNIWLNKYLLENKILKTVFYIWNEPLDIGCHVARINIKDGNDYRDIFTINHDGILDLSSYVKNGQAFTKTYSGCNGTFIPYGSTLSVESSILFMELYKREIDGRLSNNVIVSKKGDDYYLAKAGFSVSDRYINQKEKYLEVSLCDLGRDDV